MKTSRTRCGSVAATMLIALSAALLGTAAPALAAPGNDDLANAAVLTSPSFSDARDTAGATVETGEPQPSCVDAGNAGASVWYAIPADGPIRATVKTYGSKFDTVVALFTGEPGGLQEVGCNDDNEATGSQQSLATAKTSDPGTLWIQVSGFGGATGLLKVSADVKPIVTGDDFDDAVEIESLPFHFETDMSAATSESDEPVDCYGNSGAPSYWFHYAAASDGLVLASTQGSDFDSLLAVFEGTSLNDLASLTCDDDSGGDLASRAVFETTAAHSYYVQITSPFGLATDLVFHAESITRPSNDTPDHAKTIDAPFTERTTSLGGGVDTEPGDGCGPLEDSIWYRFTPASTVPVVARATSSSFYGAVSVSTGAPGSLQSIACAYADDGAGFIAQAGTAYYIEIGSIWATGGPVKVMLHYGVSQSAGALVAGAGASASTDGSNVHASGYAGSVFTEGYGSIEHDPEDGTTACAFAYAVVLFDGYCVSPPQP